jgi:hypothetical protein
MHATGDVILAPLESRRIVLPVRGGMQAELEARNRSLQNPPRAIDRSSQMAVERHDHDPDGCRVSG